MKENKTTINWEEKFENKADGNAANQIGEKHTGFINTRAFHLENHKRSEKQRKKQLNHRAAHIVDAHQQTAENILAGKNFPVIVQPYKSTLTEIIAVVKTELNHFEKRNIGKDRKQNHGNQHE